MTRENSSIGQLAGRLPPCIVFLLERLDGLTYAEIGKSLQIPARTVERYAAKALAHCFAKAGSSL